MWMAIQHVVDGAATRMRASQVAW